MFETAKIDVPTDPSLVLDYRTVALQCPKNPRASWAVTREGSGKPLTYAEFADLCNAQIYPTAHLMSRSAVRVRSPALRNRILRNALVPRQCRARPAP